MTLYGFKKFCTGFTKLGREIRDLANWLESVGVSEGKINACDAVLIRVDQDGSIVADRKAGAIYPPESYSLAGRMLRDAGVSIMELSTRLEANQIAGVLTFLAAHRRKPERSDANTPSSLKCDYGLQHACTKTSIVEGVLRIEYSYCRTRFSRLVHWYKSRNGQFSDHRALFRAAPRYTLLAAVLAATPPIVFSFIQNWTVMILLTAAAVASISVMVYAFFMTVGSVEYDNEEKAETLRQANLRLESQAKRIGADLRRARDIQQMLLPDPNRMPLGDRIDWASSFVPETEVGGDYFDAVAIDDHRVAIIFTDVSGHGMSAAFITAIVKTAFQRWVDDGGADLERFVAELNSQLYRMTPDDSFAASFIAIYDSKTERLNYINCGHSPEPWLVPNDTERKIAVLDDARAILLGVLPDVSPKTVSKSLTHGDKLMFATDGLTEAFDQDRNMYGTERLGTLIDANREKSPSEIVARIVTSVTDFASGTDQGDDQTILAMEVRTQPGAND